MKIVFTLFLSFAITLGMSQSIQSDNIPGERKDMSASSFKLTDTDAKLTFTPQKGTSKNNPEKFKGHQSSRDVITHFDDRDVFNAQFPGLPVEDYEEANVLPGEFYGFPGPLDALTDNTYFNPGDILPGLTITSTDPGITDDLVILGPGGFYLMTSKVVAANQFDQSVVLIFDPMISTVGFDVTSTLGSADSYIELYVDDVLIESKFLKISIEPEFWGMHSDISINKVIVRSAAPEFVDNIAFGNPPEGPGVPVKNLALYLGLFLILVFTVWKFRHTAS